MTEEEFSTLSQEARHPEALPTAVRWSHALLAPRLHAGDTVVDATAGNGHDTLFLARQVMPGGRIFAFDVQAAALQQTELRLSKSQIPGPDREALTLIHAGHQTFPQHLPAELRGGIRAFMFNLGWLPGSDKSTITRTDSTLSTLLEAVLWLAEGGLISIVCYPGHEGGDAEAEAVEAWASALSPESFEVQKLAFLNLAGAPPRCLILRKRTRLPRDAWRRD